MKKLFITVFCLGLAKPLFADGTNQLASETDRVSYAIGANIGQNLKRQGMDASAINPEMLGRGIKDMLSGAPSLLSEAQEKETLTTFQQNFRTQMATKSKAASEAFLTTNKLTPGVKLLSVKLPSGQTSEEQYLVITNGTGPIPTDKDRVKVNYRGTLVDGTEFDSSYKRGQPAVFGVDGVIKGWTEALKTMPVGSKWKLFIPAELAYGERGQRGIPPNSALIFEVELLSIEVAPPAPTVPPLTSDIIKVPSQAEMNKGAKIETIKQSDIPKYTQSTTNK